jgi:hypothetical protein
MGLLSKEEYLKVREENFAEALDQEVKESQAIKRATS